MIPYKVQKGNRPEIEEVIASCLDGELRDNALDFAMWMRGMKMPFKIRSSNTLIPTLQLLHTYKDIIKDENLTDIKWDDDPIRLCNCINGGCGHTGQDYI